MLIETATKQPRMKNKRPATNKPTREDEEQDDDDDDDELICLKTVRLMTFILLSTNAQDRKMTD